MPAATGSQAGGQPRRRKARTAPGRPPGAPVSEAAILDAARTLFLEAGYDGVNLERIAAAAGLSRQTLYNRFGSKEKKLKATLKFSAAFKTKVSWCQRRRAEPPVVLTARACRWT